MAHTLSKNHLHLIFSTKDRRKTIVKRLHPELRAYLVGICKKHGIITGTIGGIENHVHILLDLPPKLPLAKVVNLLKANSSRWMGERVQGFSWQEGYAAFSVSVSNLDTVTRYIQNQETHHRKMTFEEELRVLLERHGVDYDPKYFLG